MVPNPNHQIQGGRPYRDTLQRYSNKSNSNSNGRETRPLSRFANSISVEELNNLTRQINLQTSRANHMALFRSNSAPVESSSSVPSPTPMTPTHGKAATSQVTPTQMRNISNVHKAYRSYSDDSSNYSSGSSGSFDLPPSRYHHTKKFKRRVTFNEAVQVFEVSRIPILEPEIEKVQQIVPYTKTRMKIKKDTVKFEEIKSMKRPTSRIQSRMTSYVRDKLKAH